MTKFLQTSDAYLEALKQARQLINAGQEQFLKSANRVSMEIRWNLGEIIHENSIRHDWGKSVIENFSKDLSSAFPNSLGLSVRNLAYMRQFYSEYKSHPDCLKVALEVSWGVNIVIMTKISGIDIRRFYLQMAAETMCTRDIISTQILSKAYEREFLQNKKHNFDTTLPSVQAAKAENILKASYLFESSELFAFSDRLLEKQVEDKMIAHIKEVIMMLGKGFAFIGNQYVLSAGDNTYRIDLLFTNRITQSLVAVELKMTRFKAEYAGKMNLYLSLLDEQVKLPYENPSIGLILCTDRNDIEVDYVLPSINRPIGVAELKLTKSLPKDFIGKLPDPDELKKRLLQDLDGQEE